VEVPKISLNNKKVYLQHACFRLCQSCPDGHFSTLKINIKKLPVAEAKFFWAKTH